MEAEAAPTATAIAATAAAVTKVVRRTAWDFDISLLSVILRESPVLALLRPQAVGADVEHIACGGQRVVTTRRRNVGAKIDGPNSVRRTVHIQMRPGPRTSGRRAVTVSDGGGIRKSWNFLQDTIFGNSEFEHDRVARRTQIAVAAQQGVGDLQSCRKCDTELECVDCWQRDRFDCCLDGGQAAGERYTEPEDSSWYLDGGWNRRLWCRQWEE